MRVQVLRSLSLLHSKKVKDPSLSIDGSEMHSVNLSLTRGKVTFGSVLRCLSPMPHLPKSRPQPTLISQCPQGIVGRQLR